VTNKIDTLRRKNSYKFSNSARTSGEVDTENNDVNMKKQPAIVRSMFLDRARSYSESHDEKAQLNPSKGSTSRLVTMTSLLLFDVTITDRL
jgi:hypothetical protein